MKKSQHLHHLIHSLSPAEKRYLSQNLANGKKSANHRLLFQAILAQQESDDSALKKQFAGEPFVRQFHVAKNYLYHYILSSLRSYHAQANRKMELRQRIQNVEILFKKELYPLCASEIRQAEKSARSYELFPLLMEILYLKKQLYSSWEPENYPKLSRIGQEIQDVLHILQTGHKAWQNLLDLSQNMAPDKPSPLPEPLGEDGPLSGQSLQTLSYQHLCRYQTQIRRGKLSQAPDELWAIVHAWEQKSLLLRESPNLYFNALNNLLAFYTFTKEHKAIMPLLHKIREAPERYRIPMDKNTVRLQLRTLNLELEMHRDRKDQAGAKATMRLAQSFLETHHKIIPQSYLISFWYQFANLSFVAGDYREALNWINTLLNHPFGSMRTDLQTYTRLLNLFTHLELGNFMVLGYYLDSFKRHLRTQGREAQNWKACIQFFSKLIRKPLSEHGSLYQNLFQELFSGEKEAGQQEFLDYFDLKSWLSTKIARDHHSMS